MQSKSGYSASPEPAGARKRSPAGRPTAEEIERRKAVVIEEAGRQFVTRGYASTNLVDIGRASGVSTRTLYQHFGDKAGIFREVMLAQRSLYSAPLISADESLFDNMMRIAQYCCEMAFPVHLVDMLRLSIAESKRFPELMNAIITAGHDRFRTSVQTALDQLVENGAVQDDDTSTAAVFFLHLVVGDTVLMVLAGKTPSTETTDWLAPKVDLFIRGRWGQEALDTSRRSPH